MTALTIWILLTLLQKEGNTASAYSTQIECQEDRMKLLQNPDVLLIGECVKVVLQPRELAGVAKP